MSFYLSVDGNEKLSELKKQREICKSHFEDLLIWKNGSTDALCELFPLDESCPPFTFIYHRWARMSVKAAEDYR